MSKNGDVKKRDDELIDGVQEKPDESKLELTAADKEEGGLPSLAEINAIKRKLHGNKDHNCIGQGTFRNRWRRGRKVVETP